MADFNLDGLDLGTTFGIISLVRSMPRGRAPATWLNQGTYVRAVEQAVEVPGRRWLVATTVVSGGDKSHRVMLFRVTVSRRGVVRVRRVSLATAED